MAVAPHPNRTGGSPASGFPVHGLDGLAQALDSRFRLRRTSRAGLQPRSPVAQAVHCRFAVSPQARFSGAAERTALRHYSAPCEMGYQRRPTPRPCPPWLHGRYPLPSYYEDSDPGWPFAHQPWFPDSRHLNFQTFQLQPSAVLDQTRSTPSALAALFCSGFAVSLAGSPKPPTESSSPVSVYRDVFRTVRSLPVALHPGVSPRRSYFPLLALKCWPDQGLSPCCSSALSGARAHTSGVRVRASRPNLCPLWPFAWMKNNQRDDFSAGRRKTHAGGVCSLFLFRASGLV